MDSAEAAMLAALQKAYAGDAIFRPSNAACWMACPGSVQLNARLPRVKQRSKPAARQGTGAHALAQIVMTDSGQPAPEDFIGQYIDIDDNGFPDKVLVDEEMARCINDYVAIVSEYHERPGTEIYVEHKLTLLPLDPCNPLLNECRGTGDIVAVNRAERWAGCIDLKYGVHVEVAGDAPQLKIYLLMALLLIQDGQPWNYGFTTVFQPRLPIPPHDEDDLRKRALFTPKEILGDFKDSALAAMRAALGSDPALNPSEKACMWCEAAKADICPARRASALAVFRSRQDDQPYTATSRIPAVPDFTFDSRQAPPQGKDLIVLQTPDARSPQELADLLVKGIMLEAWLKDHKRYAAQLIQAGVDIPGWHLKPRTGKRRWKGTRQETEQALLKCGLKPMDIYEEPKMRSPKQVEDRLPALLKDSISQLYERPPGEPVLVRGTDPDPKPSSVTSARLGPVVLT